MKKAIILLMAVLALTSCSKKEVKKEKNLEQIYTEKGVPVKVEKIKSTVFVENILYNAEVRGIKQSTEFAMINDKVSKINAKVGQRVKKDDVIINFPTDNPSASYKQAKAAYKLANDSYKRMKALHEKGGISKQDLDNAETQYKVNKANYETAKKMLVVKAPFDGVITQVNVVKTQNVKPGDALFTIANINKLKAKVWATEEDAQKIKQGTDVIAKWLNKTFKAKVTDIALAMNAKTKAFAVEIEINNKNNDLKAGVTVDFYIETYKNKNAITVNRELVTYRKGLPYVWVCNGNKAKLQQIKVGKGNSSTIEVKSGLNLNTKIITEGYDIVSNGQKLNILN